MIPLFIISWKEVINETGNLVFYSLGNFDFREEADMFLELGLKFGNVEGKV